MKARPTTELEAGTALTLTDGRLDKVQPGVVATKGDRLPGSAGFVDSNYLQYTRALGDRISLYTRLEGQYVGREYSDLQNATALRYGNYWNVELRIRAAVRALGLSAMKGDRRSQLAFKQIVDTAQAQVYEERIQELKTAMEYKGEWQAVFERCDRDARPRPDILPHPDDIIIDWQGKTFFLVGPLDAHHRHEWDEVRSQRENCITEIASLKRYARRHPDYAKGAQDDIAFEEFIRDMTDLICPDEETRRSPAFDPHHRVAFLKALREAKSVGEKMTVVKLTMREMSMGFGRPVG